MLIERSNRIEGTADSYTPEQRKLMDGARPTWMQFSGRPLFTDAGYATARQIVQKQGSKLMAYVRMGHTWHPDKDKTTWPIEHSQQINNRNLLVDNAGNYVPLWKSGGSENPVDWMYAGDPYANSSVRWANAIAAFVASYPVDGLFVDYANLGVYNVDTLSAANIGRNVTQYHQEYQVNFLNHLRASLPSVHLSVNGKWCLENDSLIKLGLVDSVFAEKCGGLWYYHAEMQTWAAQLERRHPGVPVVWDASKTTTRLGMDAHRFARLMVGRHEDHLMADKIRF